MGLGVKDRIGLGHEPPKTVTHPSAWQIGLDRI